MKIGILIDGLGMETYEAVRWVSDRGLDGIQMYANGTCDPDVLKGEKLAALRNYISDYGLILSAVCGDIGTFGNREKNPALVEKSKRILDMSRELGTRVVTSHIGVVPSYPANPRYSIMRDALGEICSYAHSIGMTYAVETGPETSHTLLSFIEDVGDGLGVNLDPANIVMVTGENPAKSVRVLKSHIVHTHAKDGRMNHFADAELVYGIKPDTEGAARGSYTQVGLGKGQVPWHDYLSALKGIGYDGFLTIENEYDGDKAAGIESDIAFLKARLSEI